MIDSHGWSSAQNLVQFTQRFFRMKLAHMRDDYSSPFGEFNNYSKRFRQMKLIRVNVGDLENRSHTHVFDQLVKSVFTFLGFSPESFYQDRFDFESK